MLDLIYGISIVGLIIGGLFYLDIEFNQGRIVREIARRLF
jgi:uncharacterized membrane protein YciS (DUF1049 family)